MASDRNDRSERNLSEATSKLSRLLETENELEAMLEEARQTAEGLVAAARASANERVREFESTLEAENRRLAKQIADGRDQAIAAVRTEASAESAQLDGLDDSRVEELARYVIDRLVGPPQSGGAH